MLLSSLSSCADDKPTGGKALNVFFYGMHPQQVSVMLKVGDEVLLKDVWEPRKMYKKFVHPVAIKERETKIYISIGSRDTTFIYTPENEKNYLWLGYSMTNQFLVSKEDSATFRSSGGYDVVTYD